MLLSGSIGRVVQTVGARLSMVFLKFLLRPRFVCDNQTEVYGVNEKIEKSVRQDADEIILCGDGRKIDRHATLRESSRCVSK